MWPKAVQINLNKRTVLHKKKAQLPQDLFAQCSLFHCFGTPIWRIWRYVRTWHIREHRCAGLYWGWGGGCLWNLTIYLHVWDVLNGRPRETKISWNFTLYFRRRTAMQMQGVCHLRTGNKITSWLASKKLRRKLCCDLLEKLTHAILGTER